MSNFVSDVYQQFFKWEYFKKLFTRGPSYALNGIRILRARYIAKKIADAKPVLEDSSTMMGRVFDLSKKELMELDGFKMYVMADDYIGRMIRDDKTYEKHVTRVVRCVLKEGGTFLDLGANIGYYTMLASSIVKPTGKVIAFEPNPQNLQLIYASMLESKTGNVTVYPYAVSDAAGILRFTTVGSNGGVVTDQTVRMSGSPYNLLVPAVKLDDVLKDLNRLDLVKIDIEAHESAAIKGMVGLIREFKPKIITEYHPWAIEVNTTEPPRAYLDQLIGLGYKLSVIDQTGNCLSMTNAEEIISFWAALGVETMHLDLLAEPI